MIKLYILSILLLSGSLAFGQITLTGAANNPTVGASYTYHNFDASSVSDGPNGANQTWDFSSVTVSGPTSYTYVNSSGMSQSSYYPSSNIGFVDGSNESYYITNSSEFSLEGLYTGSTRDVYTDQRELVKFPITYNDVFNETFSGTQENLSAGITWNRGGTIEIKGAGYGDLILPYGTISNVLKISVVTNYTDTWSSTTVDYLDSIAFWYNTSTNTYLANWSHFHMMGSMQAGMGAYLDQASVGLLEDFTPRYEISMYPNPATSNVLNFFVEVEENTVVSTSIFDLSGKLVKEISRMKNGQNTVSVAELHSGMYVVRHMVDGKSVRSEKLVIE